jgi:hypothetical protein
MLIGEGTITKQLRGDWRRTIFASGTNYGGQEGTTIYIIVLKNNIIEIVWIVNTNIKTNNKPLFKKSKFAPNG